MRISKPHKRLRIIYSYPTNITYIGGVPYPCRSAGHDWPSGLTDLAFMGMDHEPETCQVCGTTRRQV